MARMDESELCAILAAEKADALSADQSAKLSEEREQAMDAYNGDLSELMPAQPDRSRAVSSDVADTVEGLMPSLMEIFCAGDEVVKFNPVGPEDVPLAEQETDYINHVMMQENDGFLIIYSFVKDCLISKNGFVKIHWEEKEEEERETFLGQPDDVFGLFAGREDMEIVEHSEEQTFVDGMPLTLHDFTIVYKRKIGRCRIDPTPPEEVGITRRARLGQPIDYSYHQVKRTQAELIAQGYDKAQVESIPDAPQSQNEEDQARDTVNESETDGSNINKATRLLTVTEHYATIDYEGDGKARLYKITTAGEDKGQVLKRGGKLDIEPIDFDPWASMTGVIMTHRFFGKAIADLVIDIMLIKTALMRGMLDNVYLANNQRIELPENAATKYTIDDLLNNRPGGIVRTKGPGGLIPIPNNNLGEYVYPALEYMDQVREWRSGVVRQGQGIDADALQNQSATAVAKVYNAAQAKMKLIARIMAETGFRQLFWKVHAVVRKHTSAPQTKELRNKWVTVDPREWKKRNDLTISVGLGSGGKSEQAMFWMNLLNIQKEIVMGQPGQNLVKPKNIYNALEKLMEAGGEKTIDPYFSDPEDPKNPPGEAPPDPKMIEVQGKMAMQKEELAQQDRESQSRIELEKIQAQADIATNDRKVESEIAIADRQAALEERLMWLEHQLKMSESAQEAQLKREDANRNAVMAERDAQRKDQMADRQMERDDMKAEAAAKAQTREAR